MFSRPRHFPRLAAIVLLLWLFAAGTAFAQACATSVHPCCEDCCAEWSAVAAPHELRQDVAVSSTPTWIAPPAVVYAKLPPATMQPSVWHRPEDSTPPERIPILFLRLAI